MSLFIKSVVNGTVTINQTSYTGNNIGIVNGKVTVDGKEQGEHLEQVLNVTVQGAVDRLEMSSGTLKADSVTSVKTASGDVSCGVIRGNVSTMSGDVTAKSSIHGNVSTMSGDISGV